jgi:isocitrate dehydrogenase (NAD+)
MSVRVAYVPGDAPDTFRHVRDLVDRSAAGLRWVAAPDPADVSGVAAAIREAGVGLVGPMRAAKGLPPAVLLRDALRVFAQHRPVRSFPGLPGRHPDVDVLIVRETTEDVYAHLEHRAIPGVFESLKVTTRAACERIARHAFEVARAAGRRRVTVVHKANILKRSDGLFLDVARTIAESFPDVACDDVIVDALCMKLVSDPKRFDVLLCGNLYGDILGDLGAGLVGGSRNAPSVNHADGARFCAAGHGDLPGRDGTADADPFPILLPALLLLREVGLSAVADRLQGAVSATLRAERPRALRGDLSCAAFCDAVARRLAAS